MTKITIKGGRITRAQQMEKERIRAEELKKINEERKKTIDEKNLLLSSQAKTFNVIKRKEAEEKQRIETERLMAEDAKKKAEEKIINDERQYKIDHKKEIEEAEDTEVIKELDLNKLDINLIDKIHNDAIRSRLKHEYNMQVSKYREFITELNAPTNDDMVANFLNIGVSSIPKVGDALGKAGVSITYEGNKRVQDFHNKQYQELLDKYPELAEPLTGGSYHCSACDVVVKGKALKKHLVTKKHLQGAGIFDFVKNTVSSGVNWVKKKFSKLEEFNNISRKTLETYSDWKIISITVARKPIMNVLDSVINFISLGKWADVKDKYGFDKLFHLCAFVNIQKDGKIKRIQYEKIDAVTITDNVNMNGNDVEAVSVNVNIPITFSQAIEKAINTVGKKTYFDYNPFFNNCQFALSYLLKACNAWTPLIEKFTMQDLTEAAKEIPSYTKAIMKFTTDAGQIANNVLGKGKTNNFVIHRVNVSTTIPFQEALKHAQDILKTKRQFKEKIVGNSYHFRNIVKTKFIKNSFRSKKVNPNITVVFGNLKD